MHINYNIGFTICGFDINNWEPVTADEANPWPNFHFATPK